MVEAVHGTNALSAMLKGYRDGLGTPAVFQQVLGVSAEKVDAQFDTWMRAKFAVPLRSIGHAHGHRRADERRRSGQPAGDGRTRGHRRRVHRRDEVGDGIDGAPAEGLHAHVS
jgi:hypothetical protein